MKKLIKKSVKTTLKKTNIFITFGKLMKKRIIILLIGILVTHLSLAGSYDSLMNIIKKHSLDSLSLQAYDKLLKLVESNPKLYDKIMPDAIKLAELQNNEYYKEKFYRLYAEKKELWGELFLAKKYYETLLDIYTKWDSLRLIGETKNNLGRVYEKLSNYEKAITYYIESMKIREKLKNKKGIASSLNSIGLIYLYQENYNKALSYFNQALSIAKELNNDVAIAIINNNLGTLYFRKNSLDTALYYFKESYKIDEKNSDLYGISSYYLNVANILSKKKDTINAEKYYLKSLALKQKIGDTIGLISIYNSLAVMYQNRNNFSKAIGFASKANSLANTKDYVDGLIKSNKILSEIYAALNKYREAYHYYGWYILFRDSMNKIENTKYINQLQEQFEAEKREQQIQLANSKLQQNELKLKQRSTLLYASVVVIILIASLVVVILRSYKEKKKANELLALQNQEITNQKNIIELKNKDILASITYAQRIQKAILPSIAKMKNYLPELFVIYKPKDIVSGDFYWFKVLDNIIIFSVVDCTGHGVPGAFMSIVGYNGLNQVINEENKNDPGKILDLLNETVKTSLHTEQESIRDGMDLALCCLDKENLQLKYAGANNPLYIVRHITKENLPTKKVILNDYTLYEIKATPQPIGQFITNYNFETNSIKLLKGDTLYIFSDGYADQFGGKDGKKLKTKAFKELILSIQNLSMEEQQQQLINFFENWKKGYEQIDDICIMGIRI